MSNVPNHWRLERGPTWFEILGSIATCIGIGWAVTHGTMVKPANEKIAYLEARLEGARSAASRFRDERDHWKLECERAETREMMLSRRLSGQEAKNQQESAAR